MGTLASISYIDTPILHPYCRNWIAVNSGTTQDLAIESHCELCDFVAVANASFQVEAIEQTHEHECLGRRTTPWKV